MNNEAIVSRFADTRQHIITSGKAIMLGKGFAAVGLNEILTTAGVPKGSFYHYFKSKEQFGDALLEDYFDSYMLQLELMLRQDGSPAKDRLMRFFQHWLDTQTSDTTADKCLVVKLSAEVTDLSEAMRITLKNGTERVINRLAQCIAEGVASAEFPQSLDCNGLSRDIYHMWLGATLLTKVHRNRQALEYAMQATRSKLNLSA